MNPAHADFRLSTTLDWEAACTACPMGLLLSSTLPPLGPLPSTCSNRRRNQDYPTDVKELRNGRIALGERMVKRRHWRAPGFMSRPSPVALRAGAPGFLI